MKRSAAVRALVLLIAAVLALLTVSFLPGTTPAPRLGLDLQGGTQVTLTPRPTDGSPVTDAQVSQAVEILRSRVNGLGVAEAEVTTQGSGAGASIVVSVPGADQKELVALVGQTALLDFRPVYTIENPQPVSEPAQPTPASSAVQPDPGPSPSPSSDPAPSISPEPSSSSLAQTGGTPVTSIVQAPTDSQEFAQQSALLDCTDPVSYAGGTPDDPKQWLTACSRDGSGRYVMSPAFITGDMITSADAVLSPTGTGWSISLGFDQAGSDKLAQASRELSTLPDCGLGSAPCNAFAIVLDGVVISAPRFNEPILGGQAEITGTFTAQEARDLASVLKYGALPVTLDLGEVSSVSATVGSDQLRAGLIAGALGLALVAVYLLVYYRALGLVAVASLLVAAGLVYGSLTVLSRTMGLTLTLAGVAGAIVAIGITADSFIVYFERIRDLTRAGKPIRVAAAQGWASARRTILAADFVSILAAAILYLVSVGSVRGFAFVLGLTTALDILVAFFFTRPVVSLLAEWKPFASGAAWTGAVSAKARSSLLLRRAPRLENTDPNGESK